MAKRKRRKMRRTKHRGFGGTVEQHRANAAHWAREAQRAYRSARLDARAGLCKSALRSFMLGTEVFGYYVAERRQARSGKPRIESKRGMRMGQVKAREAIVAACFCAK